MADNTQILSDPASRQIVITGASGFLGKRVVSSLSEKGFAVTALSRELNPSYTHVEDYSEAPAPPEATLVHLAECRDIQRYAESPQIAEVQKAILQKLLRKPYARVIYASSLTAGRDFGLASVPPYVVYKRAAESMVLEQRGIALRFTNLYGPGGMAENTVLMELLAQLRSEAATPLTVINSAAYIDLLHVEDAAQAIVQAILASQKELNVIARFDIASQRPITVRQLAEKMAEIAGQTGRAIQSKTDRPNSPVQTDGANAKKWLGWSPTISLEEGLHTLLDGAS